MTRLEFLLGAAAMTADRALSGQFGLLAREPLTVGIVSDVHLLDTFESCAELERALRFFGTRGVDAVLVAGDLTEAGDLKSMRAFAKTWRKVFPSKGPTGVVPLLLTGNHDVEGFRYAGLERARTTDFSSDAATNWKSVFGEDWKMARTVRIKGYPFVLANYVSFDTVDLEAVRAEIKALRGEPFFYAQHMVYRGTCCPDCGDWPEGGNWAYDNGEVGKLLSRSGCIAAFCGHSHTPLTDPRTIHEGAFSAVNCGTLADALSPIGYENGFAPGDMLGVEKDKLMASVDNREDGHGTILRVDGNGRATIERWQMRELVPLGPSVVLGARKQPLDARRCEVLGVRRQLGRTRSGMELPVTVVDFRPLNEEDGMRAIAYEVRAIGEGKEVVKKVFSPGCLRSSARDRGPCTCVFADRELPSGNCRFLVTA